MWGSWAAFDEFERIVQHPDALDRRKYLGEYLYPLSPHFGDHQRHPGEIGARGLEAAHQL